MSEDHTVSFSLELNVQQALTRLRAVQAVAFRLLGLFRRLGLPENIDAAIGRLQRFIMLANQARLAAIAFQTAAGPVGIAFAAIGIAATFLMTAETIEYEMRGR